MSKIEDKFNSINTESIEIYRALVNEATTNAVSFIKKEEKEKFNKKYDNRLHNTQLLLKNYKNLREHFNNAVYSQNQLSNEDVVDELDIVEDRDDLCINSILKSKKRTQIMIKQIDNSLEYYECKCLNSPKEEVQRRIKIIKMLYIEEKTIEDIANDLYIDSRTVSRSRKEALKELASLIFGIDGIQLS